MSAVAFPPTLPSLLPIDRTHIQMRFARERFILEFLKIRDPGAQAGAFRKTDPQPER